MSVSYELPTTELILTSTRNPSLKTLVRFVDVKRNSITELQAIDLSQATYAALSYTWGNAKQVKLELDNEGDLQLEHALEHEPLPQTIRDAIYVARELQIDYLWVDALCVRQGQQIGDKEDRTYQLSNMGRIYQQAFLTIIAASGVDANAGLSGIRRGSRRDQRVVEVIPRDDNSLGMALVTTCDIPPVWINGKENSAPWLSCEITSSNWNSRGWTFQERALSHRCLIFAQEQVYWVCDGAILCEESRYEPPEVYEKPESAMPLRIELFNFASTLAWKTIDGPIARATFDEGSVWNRFKIAAETFSRRNFGIQADVHPAFQGIADTLERMYGETFLWGHPRSRFESSLTWQHTKFRKEVVHRRIETSFGKMASRDHQDILPSWSWMGWIGSPTIWIHDSYLEL